MIRRRKQRLSVVLVAAVLILMLSACASPGPESVSVANLPPSRPTAVATESAPTPVPTILASPPIGSVSLSPWPLHGSPPFTANLSADMGSYLDRVPTCQQAHWNFGDGASEVQPCALEESPTHFQISHVYREPGTYHTRLTLTLSADREVNSTTQTVVVAVPQPIPPSDEFLRWSTWGLSLFIAASALTWLRQRSRRWKIGGYAVIALGLITFVPPFSYVPNPIGWVCAWTGSYAYDPRLPFVNRFVVAGDPESQLRPFLDGLLGQTGLDPLDPVQPLTQYEFVRVSLPLQFPGIVAVATRLTYQDGAQRTYDIPLYQSEDFLGFYRSGWRYDGLGRLRTEHRELASTPFATTAASVRLSLPQRLPLHPEAQQLDEANPANWGLYGGSDGQHLIWSPGGEAFLLVRSATVDRRDLCQIDLAGGPPQLIAENVVDYDWSPDGRYIVSTRIDQRAESVGARIFAVSRDTRELRELAQLERLVFPGLNSEGVWYTVQDDLWVAPYDDHPARRIATLPNLTSSPTWGAGPVIRPSPDGMRIAYTCGGGNTLCLYDRASAQSIQIDVLANDLTWSRDSSQLATITDGTYGNSIEGDHPVVLTIVGQDGTIERATPIAPNGWADAPQWTPDARRIFVQTHPFGGRRILTVDLFSGEVLDLSQPRWDAWFALSPAGQQLLLSNGRGSFWISAVLDSAAR